MSQDSVRITRLSFEMRPVNIWVRVLVSKLCCTAQSTLTAVICLLISSFSRLNTILVCFIIENRCRCVPFSPLTHSYLPFFMTMANCSSQYLCLLSLYSWCNFGPETFPKYIQWFNLFCSRELNRLPTVLNDVMLL